MTLLVATGDELLTVDVASGAVRRGRGSQERLSPTCVAWDTRDAERAWAGTARSGVFRSDDGGASWKATGLRDERITSIAASPAARGEVWVGTEPSRIHRSEDGGRSWESRTLTELPSSSTWAFPPRPSTHHVRWIACHPQQSSTLWAAIEAGALIATRDGGKTWKDRVPTGPGDTHELAIHPDRPEHLRSAAGDGYFESENGGATWTTPERGLEIPYLRSIAIDPGDPAVVLVSGASGPRSTYVAGNADGRVFRRNGTGAWTRILGPWDLPETIAPLLRPGSSPGELWAADERGVHRTSDGGATWNRIASFTPGPSMLRGFAVRRSP